MDDFLSRLRLIPELDAERALKALGGSEASHERVLSLTARLLPDNIERLQNAYAEGPAAYAAQAHGLKGSLAGAGAYELSGQALVLERLGKAGTLDEGLHRAFCAALTSFYERLSPLFAEPENKPPGDRQALMAMIERISEAAGDYELPLAQRILDEARAYSYGGEWDKRLKRLDILLARFDEAGAVAWIDDWKREENV